MRSLWSVLPLALPALAAAGNAPVPLCAPTVVAAVAGVAGQPPSHALTSRCQAWSAQPGTLIAVAAFAPPGGADNRTITVVTATLDSHRRVQASDRFVIQENAATAFDEKSPDTLEIDPGPYELAPGRRAFGLVVYDDDAPRCASGSVDNFLYLYLPEGRRLRPVLREFPLTYTQVTHGDPCGDHPEDVVYDQADLTLSLGPDHHHGLRDLRFSTVTHPLGHHFSATVPFDGREYPLGDFPARLYRMWQ